MARSWRPPPPGRRRMGACETTPPAMRTGEGTSHPPATLLTSRHFPRSRSSAAACPRQARSSSPAPCRAPRLRALQLDPGPRADTKPGSCEQSYRTGSTPPPTAGGHRARSACPLDSTGPHDAPMSCQGSGGFSTASVLGPGNGVLAGVADKTGRGRSGWRASSYEVTPSRWVMPRGRPADRSQASTDAAADYRVRQPPGWCVSPRRRVGAGRPRGRRNA